MAKRRKKDIYTGPNLTDQYDFYENQQLEIKIKEYHQNGVGIGYLKDIPVWIFNSIVGETVLVKISKIFPEKLIAEIVSFNKTSKKRIKPICKFYGKCTGCQWQHISYDEQLKLKKTNIVELLENLNLLDDDFVMDTIPSRNNFNYRNHARFTVRKDFEDFDKQKLGYINFLNRQWIGIDECKIMNHTINEKMKIISKDLRGLTQVSIRASDETKSFLIQPKLNMEEIESGQKYYKEKIENNIYNVASPSFFQVNPKQIEEIVKLLDSNHIFNQKDYVLDAYCGVGTFTCLIAPMVKKIVGIEESHSAIHDAKNNSKNFKNIKYIIGKTEEILQSNTEKFDTVILDPPRIGCEESVINNVISLEPKIIILISCSPENFCKDVYKLVNSKQYIIDKIIPIDMFPQTHHTEIVGILRLKP
jgi:23S rRNA (uracil1939-C5)-methyltransferase|tara:strand:+ start:5150 stop:6403 length:1254 start_codon:yes stop_codon:yes gene_type:complete